jgi:site-specific recombinase XerD
LLDATLERIFSFFPLLAPIPRELIQHSDFLFLTKHGTPFTDRGMHSLLTRTVALRTGKRFYPHMIRTVWATEFLEDNPGDFTTAATMLGDKVATVMQSYYSILDKPQQAIASAWHRSKRRAG